MRKSLILVLLYLLIVTSQCFAQVEEFEEFDSFQAQILNPMKSDTNLNVVNFWATWCKPCIEELPYFEQLNEEGINVTLVSLDFHKNIESKVLPFVSKRDLKSNIVVLSDTNYNLWIDKISEDWSGAIPATLFVKKGLSIFAEKQYHSYKELITQIHNLN